MIEVNKIDKRRIKIDTNFLKLLIIIIRIVVVKNIFRNSYHFLRLLYSKVY